MSHTTDVLVIGSGIAGLTYALKAAVHGEVLLVTKKERADSNTNYARGGIAAVLGEDDDPAHHVRDTLVAGAGLCHREAVEELVREGPDRVRDLMAWGTSFARGEAGRLSLGREGGHSRRRIVHAGDRTGREIERALLEAVAEEPRVRVEEDWLVVELLTRPDARGGRRCSGARVLDHRTARVLDVPARVTMLATGGCGQAYLHTTNPGIATGDGVAMAHRAGARVANLEFIQFHPTALYPTEDPAFLISEAVRGEGAVLRTLDGDPFMERSHPLGSLAPRDVVARAVDREMKRRGDPHVVLDVSSLDPERAAERFPGAVEGCRARGIDPWEDGIPVVPAAHYVCGGVLTDRDAGTSLAGLLAAGEVACTGVHGANRLASNSLLEAVVFSHRAAALTGVLLTGREPAGHAADERAGETSTDSAPPGRRGSGPGSVPDEAWIEERRLRLRALMWERVGIVRRDAWLEEAALRLEGMQAEVEERWCAWKWTPDWVELRNLVHVAGLIVRCARRRRESRGLHHNEDHPHRDNERHLRDTVLPGWEGAATGDPEAA